MNHIRTMIVEDEHLLLQDLQSIISWKKEGFELVATANNGKSGLKKFEIYKPQLILTDIKMPGIDGLDMMNAIKKEHPDVRFVVISSFSTFEYAQQAIRLGASDYIIKTDISPEYLREKLGKIKQEIEGRTDVCFNTFCNILKRLLSLQEEIQMGSINSLVNKISEDEIILHLPEYIEKSNELILNRYEELDIQSNLHTDSSRIKTVEELKDWLYRHLHFLSDTHRSMNQKHYCGTVIRTLAFIDDNFTNPELTLKDISADVGMSASRLCVLFKLETGMTVNDAITKRRIDEAARLLRWKNFKVYEVSTMVGYKTSQYFSKIFKKTTGIYPKEVMSNIKLS